MPLPLRQNAKEDVTDDVVRQKKTLKQALRLCVEVSGLSDKEIRAYFTTSSGKEVDKGTWSRFFNDDDPVNFPTNEIQRLMNICGNLIPLRWMALIFGFELRPIKTKLEQELEAARGEISERDRKIEAMKEIIREMR